MSYKILDNLYRYFPQEKSFTVDPSTDEISLFTNRDSTGIKVNNVPVNSTKVVQGTKDGLSVFITTVDIAKGSTEVTVVLAGVEIVAVFEKVTGESVQPNIYKVRRILQRSVYIIKKVDIQC